MKDIVTKKSQQLVVTMESKLAAIEQKMEQAIEPTRKTVLERFPILFTLLTTAGVVITFLGFELIIARWEWLYSKPLMVLALGVSILVFTGTLYKKLG